MGSSVEVKRNRIWVKNILRSSIKLLKGKYFYPILDVGRCNNKFFIPYL